MAGNFQEKRIYPRIALKTPLHYNIRGKAEFSNVVTNDISLGGLSFTDDKYIAPLTDMMLEIKILSRIINPVARVSWSSPIPHSDRYRLGIEFLELDPTKRSYLSQYLEMQKDNLLKEI